MSDKLSQHQNLPRREFLGQAAGALTAGSCIGSTICGCGSKSKAPQALPADSPTAPLRIAILGLADDADIIRRSWPAVSDRPLDLTHTSLDRGKTIEAKSFLRSARRCDVIIYPMALLGQASASETVTEFSEADLESIRETAGDLLVSLRNAIRFAGKSFAAPLGARLPAIMSTLNIERLDDWSQYDQWIQEETNGMAAEPLAPGWAGTMFMWRAASTIQGTWLFGRENLEPVITEEPYVDVLRQMKQTANRYQSERLSPQGIWQGLVSGDLKAAIGFPDGPINDGLTLSDLPNKHAQARVLLDLFTPVVSISTGCRQSAAAKQFVGWICGGDGSQNVRRQVPSMTITRSLRLTADANPASERENEYDAWLRNRLATTMTLPVIQIDSASEYFHALDQQVGRCLEGKTKPAEALRDAARHWQEITQSVGVENQMRQWRRCQGMRA